MNIKLNNLRVSFPVEIERTTIKSVGHLFDFLLKKFGHEFTQMHDSYFQERIHDIDKNDFVFETIYRIIRYYNPDKADGGITPFAHRCAKSLLNNMYKSKKVRVDLESFEIESLLTSDSFSKVEMLDYGFDEGYVINSNSLNAKERRALVLGLLTLSSKSSVNSKYPFPKTEKSIVPSRRAFWIVLGVVD